MNTTRAGAGVRRRIWRVGDVDLAVTVTGAGPIVVLAHGFPDLGVTWHHQVPSLRDAGYTVVVPDMRGYGGSSRPADPARYSDAEIAGDLVGLLDHLGAADGHFIGHDWGAASVWAVGVRYPDRVRSLTGLSVPYAVPAPAPPTEIFRKRLGEDYYMVRFQRPDVPERRLGRDPRRTLAAAFSERLEQLDDGTDVALAPPAWLDGRLFDGYVREYERTGFGGGINYYRAIDDNWRRARREGTPRLTAPALFITGDRDPLIHTMPAERSASVFTDLRIEVVGDAGHWVHQERPSAVTALLLDHLRRADGTEPTPS